MSLIVLMMISVSIAMCTSVTLSIYSGGMTSTPVLSSSFPIVWYSMQDSTSAFPMVVPALWSHLKLNWVRY